ncbi:transcriptional repressor NrdR [Candidatus Uhrbacteria bacterium]|nr:transcriptional repressor NrdR [Candidatus Uhrbacteria bacterium]
MHCPVCNHADSRVVDSRLSPGGTSIRRRRECDDCEYRFSTLEEVELLNITVVKRDGRREAFSREKMERGLRKALEKRSYTDGEFHNLLHEIERDIQRKKTNELRTSALGEIVMERLKHFDKVAYIRFASVYRSFEDVKTFQAELEGLLRSGRGNRTKRKNKVSLSKKKR